MRSEIRRTALLSTLVRFGGGAHGSIATRFRQPLSTRSGRCAGINRHGVAEVEAAH